MGKTIILIHGRGYTPAIKVHEKMWMDAITYGIKRDYPEKLKALGKAKIEFIYYGDISNQFIKKRSAKPLEDDTADRLKCLEALKKWPASKFTKETYFNLPGYNPYLEAIADSTGSLLNAIRLGKTLVPIVAPDIKDYWDFDSEYGTEVRTRMIKPLKDAMDRNDKIMVIAHSLGTMISYDTFWKFSHMGEYRPDYRGKKIHTWITIGSPLGDETVKRGLKGAGLKSQRKYPHNLQRWININAEDDYIAYDQTLKDDFYEMLKYKLVRVIKDERIYNLSVYKGKSSPHFALGYLIHPRMSKYIAGWL